jgi:ElaB/YqjD/DUF883 family membrane-anchored ribosome-binding protein
MNPQIAAIRDGITHLTEDAGTFIDSTREGISEQVQEISDSLSTGCERGKGLYRLARTKGAAFGGAIDQELHDHSYRYLAMIAGVGLLFGYVIARRGIFRGASCK